MSDLMRAVNETLGRVPEHEKAETFYEGDFPEVFASPKLRKALEGTGTHFRINFAKTPVNAVHDRLEIGAITVPEDEQANETLHRIREHNEMAIEENDTHRWGLVYGEAYVTVWPSDEEDMVDIFYNSPKTTRIFYSPENPRKKRFAAKVWQEGDRLRVNLYYPDRIEKYISAGKDWDDAEDFTKYVDHVVESEDPDLDDVEIWPIPNPYDEVPVFHFRTQKQYGRPEHKDAYGPQNLITKCVVNQAASSDFAGFPQRYVLAGHGQPTEASDWDEDFAYDEDEAGTGSEESKLRAGPGEVWWLTGDDLEVGQFTVADPDAFLDPFREYIRAMAVTTETPMRYFEGLSGQISGEALRKSEAPLVKKCEDRALMFGNAWAQVYQFALRILGFENVTVDIRWHAFESQDDLEGWQTTKAKIDAGLPPRQALLEMGYDDQALDEFGITGWEDVADAIGLVEAISQASQRIGVAVSYGVWTAEQAQEILSVLMEHTLMKVQENEEVQD